MANFESGYRSILGAKLTPTATTMTVATAPTVTSGRLYLNNGAQEERIKFTGVSGNTLTGLVRGLSKTADPATAGTGLSWIAGTEVKLVDMHDQLRDESKTETITGAKTFTGTSTFTGTTNLSGVTNIGALGDLNVLGKSNPTPVVDDDTKRDAMYTSPATNDRVYNVSAQAEQVYNGSNRDTYGISTPTPNASETVAGKVEIATKSQFDAGTDTGETGAPLSIKPSDLNNKFNSILNYFGSGADGDVVISVDTTLNADKYYNNLTINSGIKLNTAGYRIYVKGTLTNNGTILNNGGNASGQTAGVAGAGGANGGTGGNVRIGSGSGPGFDGDIGGRVSDAVITSNGGAGGIGGYVTTNNYQGGDGGVGGTPVNTTTMLFKWSDYFSATVTTGITDTKLLSKIINVLRSDSNVTLGSGCGGGGGGGGAGAFNDAVPGVGGGGGGGGGYVCIFANIITVGGTIEAKGGNGGNGANGTASGGEAAGGGGGGGGGGGLVVYVYKELVSAPTLVLTGGTYGTFGTGTNVAYVGSVGVAGNNGNYVRVLLDTIND